MKWKTFFQIALLLIITGIIAYVCVPKHKYYIHGWLAIRANQYTGVVEKYDKTQEKWIRYKTE